MHAHNSYFIYEYTVGKHLNLKGDNVLFRSNAKHIN